MKYLDWEYCLACETFAGVVALIVALTFLFIVVDKLAEKAAYNSIQKQELAERKQLIRERWYMSRDEFEDAAKVAMNLGTMRSFEFIIEKQNKIIQVLIEGDKKYHDKS